MVERADRGKHKVMEEAPSEMADVVRLYREYKLLVNLTILKKPIPDVRESKISLTLFYKYCPEAQICSILNCELSF